MTRTRPAHARPAVRAGVRTRGVAAAVLVTVLALGATVTSSANADDIDDRRAAAEERQQDAMSHRERLQSELEDTDAELAQAALDLQEIEMRLPVAQAELDAAQAEVERTQREAALLAQRLEDALGEEAEISRQVEQGAVQADAAKRNIAEMARQAYRGDGNISGLGVVTGAESTEEFIEDFAISSTAARSQARTLADLQQAEAIARNREARLVAVRTTITELKKRADDNVADAKVARKVAADRKAEVQSLIVQQKQKKATIEAHKADALAEIAQNEKDQQALEAELKGIIAQQQERDRKAAEARARAEAAARARQKAATPSGSGSGSGSGGGSGSDGGSGGGGAPSTGGGGSAPAGRGFLSYPVANPIITSSYGMRLHPVYGIYKLHAGTDFRAYCGTPIMAAADGTVLFARTQGNGNRQVVLDHGWVDGASLMTSYNHLSRWAVSPGARVSRGQVVGYSGNTGVGTACHLHLEVYVNGVTVNPMSRL